MCLLPRCPFVWCALNESPSEKEGKSLTQSGQFLPIPTLNESPSEKEGKFKLSDLGQVIFPVPQ